MANQTQTHMVQVLIGLPCLQPQGNQIESEQTPSNNTASILPQSATHQGARETLTRALID